MRSLTRRVRLSLIVLSVAGSGISASAAPPAEALEAYVRAYTEMGKNAAVLFNNQDTQANSRSKALTAWVDAQCKMLTAKAGWITAVAEARGTNAKTLQTLQQVRSLSLDNNLKVAKTFYDKRKFFDDYQKQNPRKHTTLKDVVRYSQASAPKRPASFELDSARGRIRWPEVLLEEEFADCRIRLDSLFAQRNTGSPTLEGNISRQAQTTAMEMREQLRAQVRQLSPTEYMAARRFLESLAYEARFPARIDAVASN